MEILVDDREPPEIVPLLQQLLPTVRIERLRLKRGDFEINSEIILERKTVEDFEASLIDGRLFQQAASVAKSLFRPFLLIEGPPSRFTRVSPEALQGAMIALIMQWNIPLLFTRDLTDSAHAISTIVQQRTRFSKGIHKRGGDQPKKLARRQIFFLQGLPGIGPKRALALLQHFGSPLQFMNASDAEIASIKGLGVKFLETRNQILKTSKPFDLGVDNPSR